MLIQFIFFFFSFRFVSFLLFARLLFISAYRLLFQFSYSVCVNGVDMSGRMSERAHAHSPSLRLRVLVLNISCPTVGTKGRCKKIFNWFVMCFLFLWLHYVVVFFFVCCFCCCSTLLYALNRVCVWIIAFSKPSPRSMRAAVAVVVFFLLLLLFATVFCVLLLLLMQFKWLLPLLVETWNQNNRKMARIIVSFLRLLMLYVFNFFLILLLFSYLLRDFFF